MFIVYKLTSPSGKHYIGFTGQTLKKRLQDHNSAARHKRRKIHHAINKYPLNQWDVQVLFESDNKDEAFAAEVRFIAEYDSITSGYNHLIGGAGSPGNMSSEAKAMISLSNKGRRHTEEWKRNHSKMLLGHKQSEYQKMRVKETKSKKWIVTYPNGLEQQIIGLRAFCIEHNLSQGSLTTHGHSKGFKVRKL